MSKEIKTSYANKKDIADELTPAQQKELEEAIKEADNNEVMSWEDFKKEMAEKSLGE